MKRVREEIQTFIFIYSREFAERVIGNLINYPRKSCGLYCDYCKSDVCSYVRNIMAAIQKVEIKGLIVLIEDFIGVPSEPKEAGGRKS